MIHMDCQEITTTLVALNVMQYEENEHLRQKLFNCIYTLYHESFLKWIQDKYSYAKLKDKLHEDAQDAFQNGLLAFYYKSQEQGFMIKGSLKTTIYSFCLLQLLAFFKKDKHIYGTSYYIDYYDLFFDDGILATEGQTVLNENENHLMEALGMIPKKQRDVLVMKFFYKMKSKQIAERLDVTPGNVDNDSTKAYKELRNILKSRYNL